VTDIEVQAAQRYFFSFKPKVFDSRNPGKQSSCAVDRCIDEWSVTRITNHSTLGAMERWLKFKLISGVMA
jgi:hypothetical protein